MPVTFLNPALLFGALAAVVPLVLHLLQRRRVRRVRFSDLRFLEEAQVQQARSLGWRRSLLLLLRMLVIVLLALAAARPRVAGVAGGPAGAGSLICVLDGSASMRTQQEGGTRFDAARRLCAETAAALPAGGEILVLQAEDLCRPLFADWLPASSALAPGLAGAAPGEGGMDLAAALREAAVWAGRARHRPVQVLLLSDLQDAGADTAGLAAAVSALRAAGGGPVLVRRVGERVDNGGVLDVRLPLRTVRAGEALSVEAAVVLEHAGQQFLLELDGRRVAEAVPDGEAGDRAVLDFALTAPEAGVHRGRVLAGRDRYPVDDVRPFLLEVRDRIGVLLAHGGGDGGAGAGGWRHLARALDPEHDAGGGGELFAVDARPVASLQPGDLPVAGAVFLVDPGPMDDRLLDGLGDWLRGGGRAAFLLGDGERADYLRETLLPALGLPGRAAWRRRSDAGYETLRVTAPRHPILDGLPEGALATLAEARWRRHFALPDTGDAEVLLSFDGGDPALLAGGLGAGAFLILPFDLGEEACDLALNPMFPPFAQRMASWLAAADVGDGSGSLPVGAVPRLRLAADRLESAPAGALALVEAGDGGDGAPRVARLEWSRGTPVVTGPVLRRQGFHAFVAGRDTLGLIAAAAPASESAARLREAGAVAAMLRGAGAAGSAELADEGPRGLAGALGGRELGAWLLALALLLLLAETALARGGDGRAFA